MAQRDSGYKRVKADAYNTPAWVTEAVVPRLKMMVNARRLVTEPAAGKGQMVRALRKAGFKVESSDIQRGRDFLRRSIPAKVVVTNPPYTLAREFIEHALSLTQPKQGVVAMLLNVDYDSAHTRRDLFAEHPAFCQKIVLTKRIVWFTPKKVKGKRASGPSANHAWYLWSWKRGPLTLPTIGYAP